MNRLIKTTMVLAVTALTAACAPAYKVPAPGVTPPPPSTLNIDGDANKGALASATVNVYAGSDLEKTTILATTQTEADGTYSVEVVDASGEPITGTFLIDVVADEDTTMICDATMCGDVARGETIPSSEVQGLILSTITYAETATVSADVNSLTTMATNNIITSASNESSEIDLGDITPASFEVLQQSTSEIVGAIVGIDLSTTNIYDVVIPDASESSAVASDDAIAATLTLFNASLSSLNGTDDLTLEQRITAYIGSVDTATAAVLADPEVDLGTVAPESLAIINNTQAQVSEESTMITAEIVSDTGVEIEVEELPTELDEEALGETAGEIINRTGATGGS